MFHSCRRWALVAACLVMAVLPLRGHTFTTLTADLLSDGDDLSLTLGLHLLDAIAIIDGKPTSAGNTLTASQLRAGSQSIRDYLIAHVRLSVDGVLVPGSCPGYVPDLVAPPQPGDQPAELLPERVPFLLVWTLPKGTRAVSIEFALLIDLVGSGVVHVNLHQGDRTQSHFTNLGGTVTVTLSPPSTTPPPPAVHGNPAVAPAVAPATGSMEAPAEFAPPQVSSSGMSWWQLVCLGFSHIVPEGLDHILFVVCLFLLSPRMKPLLIQVSAFTLAHSVTLGLAMAGMVLLPSRLVETLIAASIVVMAVENLLMHTVRTWRWLLVFIFGLVHGLGFAGSFASLHLPPDDFMRPLLLLNLGIELGQLAVVAACAALTWWMWQRSWYRRVVVVPASVLIALLASWWTIERAFALN